MGIARGDDALPSQHPRMRDAAGDVLLVEAPVERQRIVERLDALSGGLGEAAGVEWCLRFRRRHQLDALGSTGSLMASCEPDVGVSSAGWPAARRIIRSAEPASSSNCEVAWLTVAMPATLMNP